MHANGLRLILILSLLAGARPVWAQGTAFSYQGQLQDNGSPASGTYNLAFTLYTTNVTGTTIAGPVTNNAVEIANGLFTVLINFGTNMFTGATNWLQIGVESNGVSGFTTLTPRQQLTPVPYALFANTSSNVLGTVLAEQLSGTLLPAQLPAGVVTNNDANTVSLSNVTLNGTLTLPSPVTINSGGSSLLSSAGDNNFYAGPGAGTATNFGSANTAIGVAALQSNTNGANNTAIGYAALGNNTNGSYNTASGERALASNTSGNDNAADGRHALLNNLNGSDNTGIGYAALSANTNGSQNTVLGASALADLLRGSNNLVLGYQAGSNYGENESSNILIGSFGVGGDNNIIRIGNGQTQTFIAGVINGNGGGLTNLDFSQLSVSVVTNGEPNVSLGSLSLSSLTLPDPTTIDTKVHIPVAPFSQDETLFISSSANDNTYLGLSAGSGNQGASGTFNTGMGVFALINNTTGNNNTASGYDALSSSTSGSQNTAMGVSALSSSVSGSDNIALGYQAGENFTGRESGNIDIGNPGVAGENNIIRIGTPGTQTQTFIAGVIYGNARGLTNLNAAQLPATVVTNNEPNVTLGNDFTLTGNLNLPLPASINYAGQSLLWADANANTYLGSDAGNGGNGFFNTGVGEFALGNSMQDGGLVAIGYEALANENAGNNSFTLGGGGENTAVGYEALASDTNGAGNTALGFQALLYNESGLANTAVGDSALADCNIGSNNVAMGYSALFDNTSGSENTANGVYALQNNTSGTDNTANGAYALQNNTSGHDNVADGFQALGNCSDNTSYEVAIGYNALLNDHSVFTSFTLSGYGQNTAVGTGALSSDTSGAANTALGYYSLGNNVVGNGNTAIGVWALDDLSAVTGGTTNTAIGYEVLVNLLSGNGNIGIGSGAGNKLGLGNNNIYIGNQGGGAGIESGNIYIGTEGVHTNTYLVGTVTVNGSVVLTSDRNAKENFKPVDNQAVLGRVAALPITEWNYKTGGKDVQHIGPMAQDFQATFGLNGADDKHISVLDEGGVALAAIQGLNQKLNESDAEIEKLKVKADKVDSLEKQLHELKQLVQSLAQQK